MSMMFMLYHLCVSTNRWAGAKCAGREDLPWTDDVAPTESDARLMSEVCAQCPVLAGCANWALTKSEGGFYAGIWLPWSRTTSETLIAARRTARTALRRTAVSV